LLSGLLFEAAAGRLRAGGIDGGATFRDLGDLPVRIDDECRSIGESVLRHQDAVQLGNFSVVIAEEGIGGVEFFRPMSKSSDEVGADGEDLRL